MIYCATCGAEIPEGTAFCPNCGAGQVRQFGAEEPVITPEYEAAETEPVYRQPNYQQPVYHQQSRQSTNTLEGGAKVCAIISMICGILSILLSCFLVGILFGIAAIVLGIVSKKQASASVRNPMATAGLATGIIGTALEIIVIIVAMIFGFLVASNVMTGLEYL